MLLITGGAGFIGSNFVRLCAEEGRGPVVNVDKLTYAGNLANLGDLVSATGNVFCKEDIADQATMLRLCRTYRPNAIVNFAAESHVDRSIDGPEAFVQTNIVGTFRLLEAARTYWNEIEIAAQPSFRFVQVSTDEVYGSLGTTDAPFNEMNRYEPNSPYSASKAASDHLVRAYHHTYGLPVVTTNCSNNYGPYQFPEKLIPLCIHNALAGKPLPIYGDGQQVRDWLYVADHCRGILAALDTGRPGEVYNIGGSNEMANIDLIAALCDILDELRPRTDGERYREQITFVKDRPGHDRRYAIDSRKIRDELDWVPKETFGTGIRKTVEWYLGNQAWVENVTSGAYREWAGQQYGI